MLPVPGAAPVERAGGQVQETSPGKVLLRGVLGAHRVELEVLANNSRAIGCYPL